MSPINRTFPRSFYEWARLAHANGSYTIVDDRPDRLQDYFLLFKRNVDIAKGLRTKTDGRSLIIFKTTSNNDEKEKQL